MSTDLHIETVPLHFDIAGPNGGIFTSRLMDLTKNYRHTNSNWWNGAWHERDPDDIGGLVACNSTREGHNFILQRDLGIILIKAHSYVEVTTFGATIADTKHLMDEAKEIWPPRKPVDSMMVPMSFWSYGGEGPSSINREILGLKWDDISDNYAAAVRPEVGDVVTSFKPSTSGQLILWTGPPGTGKTTALRSLIYEWKDWCKAHYITDVEKFFGAHADYMIKVLLSDSTSSMWKLLILEDAGEFLQPTARVDTMGGSPALSRFLNTVDGLIGHGLKTLVLVTTNEPLKTLHKAVSRPGRCAADVDFKGMSSEEAILWLRERGMGEDDLPGQTYLADLYAKLHGIKSGTKNRSSKGLGFAS